MIYVSRYRALTLAALASQAVIRPRPAHPLQQTPRSPAQTIKRLPR